jgi:hypothetical protein
MLTDIIQNLVTFVDHKMSHGRKLQNLFICQLLIANTPSVHRTITLHQQIPKLHVNPATSKTQWISLSTLISIHDLYKTSHKQNRGTGIQKLLILKMYLLEAPRRPYHNMWAIGFQQVALSFDWKAAKKVSYFDVRQVH